MPRTTIQRPHAIGPADAPRHHATGVSPLLVALALGAIVALVAGPTRPAAIGMAFLAAACAYLCSVLPEQRR